MSQPDTAPALVTGVTGLVGGALVLDLLRNTEADVYCLARDQDLEPAAKRVHRVLGQLAADYGMDDVATDIETRCRVLPGDITRADCGIPDSTLPAHIGEVYHSAASLKYREADRAEIDLHNITGTRNVGDLAVRLGARAFNLISTAYVIGDRTGLVGEERVSPDWRPNNVYESSKMAAESLAETLPLETVRIMRPGIVIGHGRTHAAPTRFGLYSFVDELTEFRQAIEARLGNYLEHYRLALVGDPDVRGNLIPVDAVAAAGVRLALVGAPSGVYNLTNTEPTRLGDAIDALAASLGISPPRWVADRAELNAIDQVLNHALEFQGTYMLQDKVFDCANTRAHCGDDLLTVPLDTAGIGRYIDRYIEDGAGERVVALRKVPQRV